MEYVRYIEIPKQLPKFDYDRKDEHKIAKIYVSLDSGIKINLKDLQEYITTINSIGEKYISPTVFINFHRNHFEHHGKVVFSKEDLFKIRIWSNQLREHEGDDNEKLYLAYIICSKILNSGVY